MSKAYQAYLGQGVTRSLVAMRAEESSTRTVGTTQLQLLYGLISPDGVFDRLLSGPTNDVWIHPWTEYLDKLGVEFHSDARVSEISDRGRAGHRRHSGESQRALPVTADFYIAALPVEVMATLINDDIETRRALARQPGQIQDPLDERHSVLSLQGRAARERPRHLSRFAVGADLHLPAAVLDRSRPVPVSATARSRGILSVDISDWEAPGVVFGKPARECSAEEIKEEVWTQLKQHLNDSGATLIDDANLVAWFLDPDIEFPNPGEATNAEPLLINTAGSLQYRPEAQVELENFFLASDYVRTYTDIACMEAANEAARRAVNCLLLASGSTASAGAALAPGGAGFPQAASGNRPHPLQARSAPPPRPGLATRAVSITGQYRPGRNNAREKSLHPGPCALCRRPAGNVLPSSRCSTQNWAGSPPRSGSPGISCASQIPS